MGQAFDAEGRLLGEAYGETKREVFDTLMREHVEAHEIRIKSLRDRLDTGAETPMPKYRCHKEVWALKIARIDFDAEQAQKEGRETDGSAVITPADQGYAPFRVDAAYVRKHGPVSGGYYVVYKDGYKSFSPAEAFEGGYTRI